MFVYSLLRFSLGCFCSVSSWTGRGILGKHFFKYMLYLCCFYCWFWHFLAHPLFAFCAPNFCFFTGLARLFYNDWIFVGFSCLRVIALKASSHFWPVFVGFSLDFCGPTENEFSARGSAIIGVFSWPFRQRWCPTNKRKHVQTHGLGKHWREHLSLPSARPITTFSCKRTMTT